MSDSTLIALLDNVSVILKEQAVNKHNAFNLLEVMGIGTREVYMCRVLTELLNPKGSHEQKGLYLNLFFDSVLVGLDKPDTSVEVHNEWYAGGRPIDIVIKDNNRFIPIEVKIFAGDQENQCADYAKYAKNAPMYYLTIDGHPPSDYSAGTLSDDKKIELISWRAIVAWLNLCIQETSNEQTNLLISLEQFTQAIINFCEKDDAIMDFIQSKPEYVQAALAISKSIMGLREPALHKIDRELLGNGLTYPMSKDRSLTYVVDEPNALFFRVQFSTGSSYSIVAGFITGYKDDEGMWEFHGGKAKYIDNHNKLKPEFGGNDSWWLQKKTIIPEDEFHLLYDNGHFDSYIAKIVDVFNNRSSANGV